LSHEQSCASTCHDRRLPLWRFKRQGKSVRNKFPRLKPRNPLKSLDSDERIHGNPRQSNPHERGLRSETTRGQENPNGSTGPMSRPVAETEPNRLHPKAKRPRTACPSSTSSARSLAEDSHRCDGLPRRRHHCGFDGRQFVGGSIKASRSAAPCTANADLIVLDKPTAALIGAVDAELKATMLH
jgi:hypothetical protein